MAIAFSGGVDSTFLLAAAKKAGPEKLIAVTISSQFVPDDEIQLAKKMARTLEVEHILVDVNVLEDRQIAANTKERCYYCKTRVFEIIKKIAGKKGIEHLLHAVNLDDLKDYRPGLKAADELGFIAPLADAKLTKSDIRKLSKEYGLETWNKPSQSCLATRIPYNTQLTEDALNRIDKAENFLHSLGFTLLRVRCHGNLARIELDQDQLEAVFKKDARHKISETFKKLGFDYISIDIDGYKTGKMNDEILRS